LNEPIMEKFSWLTRDMTVNDAPGNKVIIKGPALFSVEKYFGQGVSKNLRRYVQDELTRSARTLKGAPIDVNHEISVWEERKAKGLTVGPKPTQKGNVIYGEEEDGQIEYVAEINHKEYVSKVRDTFKVRKGLMKESEYIDKWGKKPLLGVSVDAQFHALVCSKCGQKFFDIDEYKHHMVDVEVLKNFEWEPHYLTFERLSLVEPPEQPGVVGADFQVVETVQNSPQKLIETLAKTAEEEEKYRMSKIAVEKQESIAFGRAGIITSLREAVEEALKPQQTSEEPKSPASIVEKEPEKVEEAHYPWDQCVADRMAEGHDRKSAENIYGAIKAHSISHTAKPIEKLNINETAPKMKLGEPFAGYVDFADCVSKNSDKSNPEAYCGHIKHQTEHETFFKQKVADKLNELVGILNSPHELPVQEWLKAIPKDDVSWKKEVNEIREVMPKPYDDTTVKSEIKAVKETIPKPYDDTPTKATLKEVTDKLSVFEAKFKEYDTIKDAVQVADKNILEVKKGFDEKLSKLEKENAVLRENQKIKETVELSLKEQLDKQQIDIDNFKEWRKSQSQFKGKTKEIEQPKPPDLSWSP